MSDLLFKTIEIRFVDIHGHLKTMNLPLEKSASSLEDAKEDSIFNSGANIDGSSVDGFTPIERSDLHLKPLKETTFRLSYAEMPKLACMCEIQQNGNIFAGDTRSRLKLWLDKLLGKNISLMVGSEPEFFILKDRKPVDSGNYGDVFPGASASGLVKRFSEDLAAAGLDPRVHHHEVAPGQYEIELGHGDALSVADKVINYKGLIRALATKKDLEATFMPKPFENMNGNGMHFHLSLWDNSTSTNLFSAGHGNELSEMAHHFIAGLLSHAKALTAVVAPTVNSYKRLVPGYEAPVYIAWAPINRSALIRVPMFTKPEQARIEYRCSDPSCNVYLALTSILAAGMDGVKNKMELCEPVRRNIFQMTARAREQLHIETLPGDLHQAIECFKQDHVLREALGEFIDDKFLKLKAREWVDYSKQVTDWDWKRYFGC